jgi:serine/threonine-protein kinase HipA
MNKMIDELDVYLNSELSGSLKLERDDEMTFTYSDTAVRPVSVGMPLHEKSYGHKHCEAFFGGLLPEGDAARKAIGKRFGVSEGNTFSLLRSIGAECAGALSIISRGESVPAEGMEEVNLLSEKELAEHIRELPRRPLFVEVKGIRLSLAGVQDKAAVTVLPEGIGIPKFGPTTHILKPDLREGPGVIFCEYLCMKSAASLGIDVAEVQLRKAEDLVYLLVQRYDRIRDSQRSLTRVHQEDFCQAMAIPSKKKYQEDGGPSLKDCFHLLTKTAVPALARQKLLTAVVFNFLVSNLDAHGKNFSLLHGKNVITLAPLYDLVCTAAFPDYSQELAMEIGDYYEPKEIFAHQWRTLCEDIGYSFPAFKRIARSLYSRLPSVAEKELSNMQSEGRSHSACERAVKIITANCTEMEARLNV